METATELSQELVLQRLWGRRLPANITEDDLNDFLEVREVFLPAQDEVEENLSSKSRPASPLCCVPCSHGHQNVAVGATIHCKTVECVHSDKKTVEVDGATIGDIPAKYKVFNLRKHEFPVIGIFVDPRVVPGYKYRVHPIQENGSKEKWLFKGKALELQSIGRGYSRRLTFAPENGELNDNPHYFWADSNEFGFGFELEVVSPGDKFTVFDANHLPVGTLEVLQNQAPQEEVGHRVLNDRSIEKTARVRCLCKVEWYEGDTAELIVPMSGIAVSVKSKTGVRTKLLGVTIGNHPRRGFTLSPGINNRLRSTVVRGSSVGDVPTVYTITGLEDYELPVIGTYIDSRILPGFHYRVRPAAGKRKPLFSGKPLCLVSIGRGYGKRLTFESESLNSPENYLWSDSHPDGLGFEPSAVRAGMKFEVFAGELRLGEASVFRADAPQFERRQEWVEREGERGVLKEIQVELTCQLSLDIDKVPESHTMRVSGTAVLFKKTSDRQARILRLDNIGLDSQLNILFNTQWDHLVFIPLREDKFSRSI